MDTQKEGEVDCSGDEDVVECDGNRQAQDELGEEVRPDERVMQCAGLQTKCFSVRARADIVIGDDGKVQGENVLENTGRDDTSVEHAQDFGDGSNGYEEKCDEMTYSLRFQKRNKIGRLEKGSRFGIRNENGQVERAVENAKEDVNVKGEGGDRAWRLRAN